MPAQKADIKGLDAVDGGDGWQAAMEEVVGDDGIDIDTELLDNGNFDEIRPDPNGPEMVGLAASGDQGPTHKLKVQVTAAFKAQFIGLDGDAVVPFNVAMVVTCATVGALGSLPELKSDEQAMRIIFSCTLACVILRAFATAGASWDTAAEEALVTTVDASAFKALVSTGSQAVSAALGWKDTNAKKAWNAGWPKEMAKGFMIMLATKVTHYLTNHHTKQEGKWTSYSAKAVKTIMGLDPMQNDNIETAVWTVGHLMSTLGAYKFLFSQMAASHAGGRVDWDACVNYTRGSSFYPVVSKFYRIGTDIVQRLTQLPAGCRYVANIIAVARRIRDSSYTVFVTQEMVDHVGECAVVFAHASKVPILYHVGASWFCAGLMPDALHRDYPKEIPKRSDLSGQFAAYLVICMNRSDMAKMRCLGDPAMDSEFATTLSAARGSVRTTGGAKETMEAILGKASSVTAAKALCEKLGDDQYDASTDHRTIELTEIGKRIVELKKKKKKEKQGASSSAAAAADDEDESDGAGSNAGSDAGLKVQKSAGGD